MVELSVLGRKNVQATSPNLWRLVRQISTDLTTFTPIVNPGVEQALNFLWQGTQFAKMTGIGDARVYDTTAPSSIDEETLASVVAYATFDDIGGNGASVLLTAGPVISDSFTTASFTTLSFASNFLSPEYKVPLLDGEGRTAYYRGHYSYMNWSSHLAPEVTHTKQFMLGHSLELNVPGTVSADQKAFAYYDSHANFNVSSSISVSLWFYPTDLSAIGSELYRWLLWRYIDASNYYAVTINTGPSADLRIRIFVNEGGTITKAVSDPVVANTWNLIIFTYDPTTNVLTLYLNNVSSVASTSHVLTIPYTTDTHMYLGGLPSLTTKRFTGYLDNFVFWSGKILNSTEASNMWTRGTIV